MPDLIFPLTNNFALLKSKIESVDSLGASSLDAGLKSAIDLMDANPRPSQSSKTLILMPDGEGPYTPLGQNGSFSNVAFRKEYRVFTIGLMPSSSDEAKFVRADGDSPQLSSK